MEKRIFEIITGDKNFIKRFFLLLSILPNRRLMKEYNEYRKVWKLLDTLPYYNLEKENAFVFRKYLLYPAFAFAIILLILGIFFGKNSYKYDEYITLTEEVMPFEE
uniref:Uncharacterized protein n=1 Tax=candidate division WOR-3 bacterium TaxID=2052148 RepID=A0A7C4YJ80_UNCW3